ncbi:histidine phosphatase family protein [Pontibacter sp. Tf4]|uniref:SixA phosphatase family protein n=1 Tax=Pontibacter sp. Tf4 TaxID=2761620 RepID=UPI0016244ADA|nr:histidine phosphatase family protein [Pontibacter sp. Tf4]MBB6610431.1 histidine phosphatase family protein [Pontibacter sp. Tf4]
MQRYLYLCRHAEAQDTYLLQSDFERDLTPEGIRQAHETGKWLREQYQKTDAIVSSPARRAGATARILSERLYFDAEKITYAPDIYNPKESQLLKTISQLPATVQKAIVVSHNPALTQLLRSLVNKNLPYLEPGQVAVIAADLETWEDIFITEATLLGTNLPQRV